MIYKSFKYYDKRYGYVYYLNDEFDLCFNRNGPSWQKTYGIYKGSNYSDNVYDNIKHYKEGFLYLMQQLYQK